MAAKRPPGSVRSPYCEKQSRTYSFGASITTYTPQRRSRNTGRPSRSSEDTTSTVPRPARMPPSSRGRSSSGRSSTPQAGKARPSGGGVSSQALATAAISSADLVPSRKELNICALKSPVASCASVKP